MSEGGQSAFEIAKNNLKKSLSAQETAITDQQDKIVYDIPDVEIREKIERQPKRKASLPSSKETSPLIPPRPFEDGQGKYHHKVAPPTPEEVEPVEKKPIKLTKMPKYIGKSFKLPDFMEKFRNQFPLAVKVSRGFYGESELYTLSEGEKFIICFLTDYETVCGVEQSGSIFEIPVNQNYLISLLSEKMEFDPRTQETVTSLLSLNPTPKRVAARNNFSRNGATVKIGDLLDVISINYDEDSGSPLNVILKTTEGKEVHFNEHDTEQFSLRLSLTSEKMEIALQKCIFPQRVYLYPQNKNKYTSNNKPYTLLEIRKGQMFISYVYEDKITYVGPDNIDDAPLVEIPLDLDIEVEVLGKPVEKLYETKEEIYSAFKDVRKLLRKEEDYGIAADYMKNKMVDIPSHKLPGARFLTPKSIKSPLPEPVGLASKKELTKVARQLSEERRRNGDLNRMAQKLDDIISEMNSKMEDLNAKCTQKDRYIKELLSERDLPPLPSMERGHALSCSELDAPHVGDNFYTRVDSPVGEMNPFSTIQPSKSTDNQYSVSDVTDKKVEEYSVQDVKELLEKLKLSQYVEKFVEEGINGEILSVLDESILENDLGITSGLHKKKILKIIEKLTTRQDISHYMPMSEVMSIVKKPEKLYQQL